MRQQRSAFGDARRRTALTKEPIMTDKPSSELTTKQSTTEGRSAPKRVTGKLKAACDIMIWQGKPWNEAALQVKYSTRSMRLSLEKQHVIRYLRSQRGIRLAALSGENLDALQKARDQKSNPAAAVQAARALESLASEQFGGGSVGMAGGGARAGWIVDVSEPTTAGLVIVVNHPAPVQPAADEARLVIDVTPNRTSEDDRH
jgi:hypothetical protein